MKKAILIILAILISCPLLLAADSSIYPKQDADRQALQTAYQAALTDLQTIQNYTSPTNAQVIAAVKKLAQIQEKQLRYMKKLADRQ
jgi:outer membrane biogenesis lipoprotein LolB